MWIARPSAAEWEAVYPERAIRARVSGMAEMDCEILSNGGLSDCRVVSEDPSGYGIGAALNRLRGKYLHALFDGDGMRTAGRRVVVRQRLRFEPERRR